MSLKKRGGNKDSEEIIVKRRSKKGHDDEHGGAWKVAFADFTMAMMALFMVLWIVNPRQELHNPSNSDQDNNPLVDGGAGVFDGTSNTPLELDGLPPAPPRKTEQVRKQDGEAEAERQHYETPAQMQQLARLMEMVALKVDAMANVEIEVVPQGLRILIKDDQKRFMFPRGSADLDPHFRTLLRSLAEVLAKVDNKLIISGHTDAVPYRGKTGYNNWNLSGERALRARNVLVDAGLPPAGILQVAAQADVMPLLPEDPENGANRRIELLLLTTHAEELYRELFGNGSAQACYSNDGTEFVAPVRKSAL